MTMEPHYPQASFHETILRAVDALAATNDGEHGCRAPSIRSIWGAATTRRLRVTEFVERSETMREALGRAVDAIDGETVTLRALIALIGEHGLLFICALLTIPFLIPVSIPGVSTVFGLGI